MTRYGDPRFIATLGIASRGDRESPGRIREAGVDRCRAAGDGVDDLAQGAVRPPQALADEAAVPLQRPQTSARTTGRQVEAIGTPRIPSGER
jgi:hypothetical protein